MATFLVMFRLTQKGIENIKDSPGRVQKAKQLFQEVGAQVKEFYGLMGQYDTIFIVEAPNDEIVAQAALAVASFGNVQTETLRAFTEEEFGRLIAALP